MIIYDLPIKIEIVSNGLLVDDKMHHPTIRTFDQIKDVLRNKECPAPKQGTELYYMFRKVYSVANIRYDIVFMPARFLGDEYNKTHGHYHPVAEKGLSYPEIYQVLKGEALFLLQKKNVDYFEVLYVSAKTGDVLLIPPNYGHVSINESDDKPLILANIVYDKFESLYGEYTSSNGATFYYTKSGFVHNTNYVVRKFDKVTHSQINNKYGFACNDLLKELYTNPEKFRFLEKPSLLFK